MRVGIVGLPNSGKTTVFNVLSGGSAPTAAYTGGTFQVNTAVVLVPDERVDALSRMYQPKKTTNGRSRGCSATNISINIDAGAHNNYTNDKTNHYITERCQRLRSFSHCTRRLRAFLSWLSVRWWRISPGLGTAIRWEPYMPMWPLNA